MSPALALDAPRAGWLAGLDPALALLPAALAPASTDSGWRLHDARWEPGKGCRLAYRVDSAGPATAFVSVDVSDTEWHLQDYLRDTGLPGLGTAADPDWVAARLGPTLPEPVVACGVEPVRYRPGAHCVLRYVVDTASGRTTLYGKVFGDHRFADLAPRVAALAATTAGARLVPPVRAAWPEIQTTVGAGVPGRTVSAILGDPAVPAAQRARIAYHLGGLLAAFHGIDGVDAPTWSAEDQLTSLGLAVGPAHLVDPLLADRLGAELDVLAERIPPSGAPVLGHGGFRAGQVVVSASGMVMLDIDGLCHSDPGRDLGTVLAHLRWQGVRQPGQRRLLLAAEQGLLSGYQARAGRLDPDSLAWWRAAGLVQVALRRYRRLEIADWPSVPALVDAAAELLLPRRARRAEGGATNLLDPTQMTAALRVGLRSPVSRRTLVVDSAEKVASAPGRRTVVRYQVRGLDGAGPVPVIGKTFTDPRRAHLLHEHLHLLHDAGFAHGNLRVPEPLGLLPAQRLVLYRQCPGTPLARVRQPDRAEDGVRRAAQWLARLHTGALRFPRRFSLDTEEQTTRSWAATVGQWAPALAGDARALATGWAEAARSAHAAGDVDVPIHKDFHPGHVLLGELTWVIDLDEARQGDPAFDVAHFCAYLDLAPERPGPPLLAEAFVEEYSAAVGWRDNGRLGPYQAYTWLKIAKQWATARGPGRDASPARRAAGTAEALRRGRLCLDG